MSIVAIVENYARKFDDIRDEDFHEFIEAYVLEGTPVNLVDEDIFNEMLEEGTVVLAGEE